ncbi:WD repeat-containing protein 76-like [Trifolium pratense]|uniref:WD repeat-containing protein 76-like n=1 Tax=Trifolium pratense TaxID=57577 RepID=A0A2K3N425_TRIPR|nr:WD repeat-containing protein 76-like [Trifolium pratense]
MIGIHRGVNFEDAAVVNLESVRKGSTYRAIWGWDDSYLFTGSDTKGISVVSTAQKATVMTLESPLITAFPQKFDAHPYKVGMLAGGTAGALVRTVPPCVINLLFCLLLTLKIYVLMASAVVAGFSVGAAMGIHILFD